MKRKIVEIIAIFSLFLVALFLASFLWRSQIILTLLLIPVGIASIAILKEKAYLQIYIIAAILGPAAEIVAIHFGAWSYTAPNFLRIPYWLPFVWGEAGVFFGKIFSELTRRK